MESRDRKRSKAKKWFSSKRAKRAFCLAPDQRGFLISCNFREKEAIREAYVLLNEYADRLYGSEIEPAEPASDNDSEDDIDACLEAETEALKAQSQKKENERRFQVVESSVKNFLFIRTTIKDPVGLVTNILEDIERTGVHRVRNLLRLIPIELTCKAFEKNISEALKTVLTPHFQDKTDATSYVVVFKVHCHNTITKDIVINIVGSLVKEMNPNAVVDYKNADLTVMVDIIKDIFCVGVVPKFYQFKKYNPGELANHHNRLKEEAEKAKKQIENPVKETNDKIDEIQNNETNNVIDKSEQIEKEQTNEIEKAGNDIDQTDKVQAQNVETTNGTGCETTKDPEDESKVGEVPEPAVESVADKKVAE